MIFPAPKNCQGTREENRFSSTSSPGPSTWAIAIGEAQAVSVVSGWFLGGVRPGGGPLMLPYAPKMLSSFSVIGALVLVAPTLMDRVASPTSAFRSNIRPGTSGRKDIQKERWRQAASQLWSVDSPWFLYVFATTASKVPSWAGQTLLISQMANNRWASHNF